MKRIKIALIVILFVFALFSMRITILRGIGEFLLVSSAPKKSDVIAILRGDRNFCCTIEAFKLFKEGYADVIYIPIALADTPILRLKERGIRLLIGQERILSLLTQLGVPKENVLVGKQKPGGGTFCELKRIKTMMQTRGYRMAIIVTSWYHTRRTDAICRKILRKSNLKYIIVGARNDFSSSSDWWRYRYEAISVLEEYVKLCMYYLSPFDKIRFSDDPEETPSAVEEHRGE